MKCDPGQRADKAETLRREERRAQTCSRDYPETVLAADHLGAHKQLRDPGSNARISKLLCLKLGRREGLEVVSCSCLVWAASG